MESVLGPPSVPLSSHIFWSGFEHVCKLPWFKMSKLQWKNRCGFHELKDLLFSKQIALPATPAAFTPPFLISLKVCFNHAESILGFYCPWNQKFPLLLRKKTLWSHNEETGNLQTWIHCLGLLQIFVSDLCPASAFVFSLPHRNIKCNYYPKHFSVRNTGLKFLLFSCYRRKPHHLFHFLNWLSPVLN